MFTHQTYENSNRRLTQIFGIVSAFFLVHIHLTFAELKPISRVSAGRQQYHALPALYTTASSIPISAPTPPNPGDPWDGDWFVDEGSVVVRAGAGPE